MSEVNFKQRRFNSKILLIGEYTVLFGSKALAIPLDKYYGEWSYQKGHESNAQIQHLKQYLLQLYYSGKLHNFDFDALEYQIAKGLSFHSSIPQGYGVGSSGSITAAIFDAFRKQKELLSIYELREVLGKIESCYHGESSGLDPLVSYLNQPILIHDRDKIELIDNRNINLESSMHLLDTGISRKTSALVESFIHTVDKSPKFKEEVEKISQINDQLIDYYLMNNTQAFIEGFQALSWTQLETLPMLIPEKYKEIWKQGHRSGSYDMKLCGAGGGGFFMIMMYNESEARAILKQEKLIPLI